MNNDIKELLEMGSSAERNGVFYCREEEIWRSRSDFGLVLVLKK